MSCGLVMVAGTQSTSLSIGSEPPIVPIVHAATSLAMDRSALRMMRTFIRTLSADLVGPDRWQRFAALVAELVESATALSQGKKSSRFPRDLNPKRDKVLAHVVLGLATDEVVHVLGQLAKLHSIVQRLRDVGALVLLGCLNDEQLELLDRCDGHTVDLVANKLVHVTRTAQVSRMHRGLRVDSPGWNSTSCGLCNVSAMKPHRRLTIHDS